MTTNDITHAQLVKAGQFWLLNTMRCRIAVAELRTAILEQPDVMGWKNTHSHLIECKVSRSDFLADGKKLPRRPGGGVGNYRWYLTPAGLLNLRDEVPEYWGLLEYCTSNHTKGYYIKKRVDAQHVATNVGNERIILVSIAWRALEAQKLVRPLAIGGEE